MTFENLRGILEFLSQKSLELCQESLAQNSRYIRGDDEHELNFCWSIVREILINVENGLPDDSYSFFSVGSEKFPALKKFLNQTKLDIKISYSEEIAIWNFRNEHAEIILRYVLKYCAEKFNKIFSFTPTIDLDAAHRYYEEIRPAEEYAARRRQCLDDCNVSIRRKIFADLLHDIFFKNRNNVTARKLKLMEYVLRGRAKNEVLDETDWLQPATLEKFFSSLQINFSVETLTTDEEFFFSEEEKVLAEKFCVATICRHFPQYIPHDDIWLELNYFGKMTSADAASAVGMTEQEFEKYAETNKIFSFHVDNQNFYRYRAVYELQKKLSIRYPRKFITAANAASGLSISVAEFAERAKEIYELRQYVIDGKIYYSYDDYQEVKKIADDENIFPFTVIHQSDYAENKKVFQVFVPPEKLIVVGDDCDVEEYKKAFWEKIKNYLQGVMKNNG